MGANTNLPFYSEAVNDTITAITPSILRQLSRHFPECTDCAETSVELPKSCP